MMKQEAKEPHILIESSKLWLRSLGPAVPQTLIEAGNNEKDVFGVVGLLHEQKIIVALRMLAYGEINHS
ncbi:hypothetical protein ACFX2G_019864 [Malus domestica]